MKIFRNLFRKSTLFGWMMARISYPVIWFFLQADHLFTSLSDGFIKKAINFFMDDSARSKRILRMIARRFMPDRFTDKMAKRIHDHDIPLRASIASSLFLRHSYCNGLILPEWKLNPKLAGRAFARELGLPSPEIFSEKIAADTIPFIERSIIKPAEGYSSNGVFAVYSRDHIIEFKTGKVIGSWHELLSRIRRLLVLHVVANDSWMVEELICEENGAPAHDLKFNSFYGQIGWIDEMIRYPRVMYNIMDAQGRPFRSELYGHDQFFTGAGVSAEEMELSKRVSLEIPAPFIRIDFLRTRDRLLLCEFTPRPGVIGYYNRRRDQLYGQLFHKAEARLYTDLISGKRFEAFNKINKY